MVSRALVLGGGGLVGIAWETGLLKGLRDGGVDPAAADLVIGTSAGSITGTQMCAGVSFDTLYAAQLEPDTGEIRGLMAGIDVQAATAIFTKWATTETMTPTIAAEVGQMALAAQTVEEPAWLEGIDATLQVSEWPAGRLIATAVDALTGELAAWDRDSGAPLLAAIASSCAVPGLFPPVTINGRRYVDGGLRSGSNADLAKGHDLVLLIAPIGASPQGIGAIARRQLDGEAALLREFGSTVHVILPDEAALEAFGPDLMDPARRALAAEAGLRQGAAAGAALRQAWSGIAA